VVLGRPLGNEQFVGDLAVCEAARDKLRDLLFPTAQRGFGVVVRRPRAIYGMKYGMSDGMSDGTAEARHCPSTSAAEVA